MKITLRWKKCWFWCEMVRNLCMIFPISSHLILIVYKVCRAFNVRNCAVHSWKKIFILM